MGNNENEPNWRLALIQASIVWGGYLILGTEILSLFGIINRLSLSIMWGFPFLVGVIWVWLWLKSGKILRLPVVYHSDSWMGVILDSLVILILVITAIIAIITPPNSSEAMVSRMSRVAHWEQNQTLAHYPTGIETQNSNSPGAEMIFLNFYILDKHDGLINFVAWLSFAGCIAATASLAEVLGTKINSQRMAAIFTATLPIAVTQATSALNSLMVSFWVVSAVLMLLTYIKKSQKTIFLILAAAAAALAVVTKPMAFIFLWPFGLYAVVVFQKRLGLHKMLMWTMVAFTLLAVFNGGHFLRNQQTYGQFYHPVELAEQMNDVRNWRVMVSNVSRNGALHAGLPFPWLDDWLMANLETLHIWLDVEISAPYTTIGDAFTIPSVSTSEMTSGNPVHMLIIILSFLAVVTLVLAGKKEPYVLVFMGAIIFSFTLFCYFFKWQPSGGRHHLPFFILFSPILAVLVDRMEKYELEVFIAALLLIYAMFWLFQTEERPVIPDAERTYPVSVLTGERTALYFVSNLDDYPIYMDITDAINQYGIRQVGLDLTSTSEEYPFWVLLGAPSDDLHIEWVSTDTASAAYLRPGFTPGAIICEACSSEKISGYTQQYEHLSFGRFNLFFKEQ